MPVVIVRQRKPWRRDAPPCCICCNRSEDDAPESQLDPRRLEEKFAVVNTGIYECRSCGYKYDASVGDASYPVPPGLPFEKLLEDWRCPTCCASQSFFESKRVEIAGFAQNQQLDWAGTR